MAAERPSICSTLKGQSSQSARRNTNTLTLIYSANRDADGRINDPLSSDQRNNRGRKLSVALITHTHACTHTHTHTHTHLGLKGINDVWQEAEVKIFPNTHTFNCVCVLFSPINQKKCQHTHTHTHTHTKRCSGSEFSCI